MNGLACPKCGRTTGCRVLTTRDTWAVIRRRRQCPCGHRFRTYESTEPPAGYLSQRKEARRAMYFQGAGQ